MKRKTIEVAQLVDVVNTTLKGSRADAADIRQGMMNLLEHVLHQTNNYSGFRYLLKDEVVEGQPGVNYLNGQPHPDFEKRFENTDKTRVMYFIK